MIRFISTALLALSILVTTNFAHAKFLPYTVKAEEVESTSFARGSVTEEIFFELVDFFEDLYREEIMTQADSWEIDGEWNNGDIQAYAMQYSGKWTVTIYGGLARHHVMTPDAVAMVLCHEIGHHLGGAPKKREVLWTSWVSLEGQADYYATSKCFLKYTNSQIKSYNSPQRDIPQIVINECDKATKRSPDTLFTKDYCIRAAHAAFLTEKMVRITTGRKTPISFLKTDNSTVDKTMEAHPEPQCRLDTSFNALRCPIDHRDNFDDEDYRTASCHEDFYPEYSRPRCWFNSEKY